MIQALMKFETFFFISLTEVFGLYIFDSIILIKNKHNVNHSVFHLRESNIDLPGTWMYRIGNTKGHNIEGPDMNTGDGEFPSLTTF